MSTKNYNNKLYLSSNSSTVIYDDENIPALLELKKENTVIEQTNNGLRADLSEPKEGTLENLLMWAWNRKNDSATFHCKVMIENIRTRKGWNYPSCGDDNCKKGATRQGGKFFCEACNKAIEYSILRLELGVADDLTATFCRGCGASNPILTMSMVPLKSFTCWKINTSAPIDEDIGSSTMDAIAVNPSPSFKRLSIAPSMSTPFQRSELEDSDAYEVRGPYLTREMVARLMTLRIRRKGRNTLKITTDQRRWQIFIHLQICVPLLRDTFTSSQKK
ncbi:DNA helicase PIF1, ATP-dependent [Tanacetum coccineum]